MAVTKTGKPDGRGRPRVGKRTQVILTDDQYPALQRYADEHTGGNWNAALREMVSLGLTTVGIPPDQQQEEAA